MMRNTPVNAQPKFALLFVCLGNICRSPSAEAVMQRLIQKTGLSERFLCDSAGTSAAHAGEPADIRSQRAAAQRGYHVTSISRQVTKDDLRSFDMIIAMDDANQQALYRMAANEQERTKIFRFVDFCQSTHPGEVPDPYYGGAKGFEEVLDILEDGCNGILAHAKLHR